MSSVTNSNQQGGRQQGSEIESTKVSPVMCQSVTSTESIKSRCEFGHAMYHVQINEVPTN